MKKNIIEIKSVNKLYGANHVVKDLNLDIYEGEFLTLLGSSGCGKTTTLRMIAGFEQVSSGKIKIENEEVEGKEPFERNVNTVFQSYALFPHKTIFQNIAYGLKIKKVSKEIINEKVNEMLSLVQLDGFGDRYPDQLSGGQKQRVAIARALINEPKVLLLDEPLGALDLKLRKQMQLELKQLQRKLNITFVYVTHDQEEALTMSDRIAVMHQGVIDQIGTPEEIYEKPKTKFVATFIGETNVFDGYVEDKNSSGIKVRTEEGYFDSIDDDFEKGDLVNISIRPEKLRYSMEPVGGFELLGEMSTYVYVGSIIKGIVTLSNGNRVTIERLAGQEMPLIGTPLYLHWHHEDAVLFHSLDNAIYQMIENTPLVEKG